MSCSNVMQRHKVPAASSEAHKLTCHLIRSKTYTNTSPTPLVSTHPFHRLRSTAVAISAKPLSPTQAVPQKRQLNPILLIPTMVPERTLIKQ